MNQNEQLGELPDLNKIFQLSYNFDLLKSLLEGLLKAQKKNQDDLKHLQNSNLDKDDKIKALEKTIIDLNMVIIEKVEGGDPEKIKELQSRKENLENEIGVSSEGLAKDLDSSIPSKNIKKTHIEKKSSQASLDTVKDVVIKPISDGIELQVSVTNDDTVNKIIRKINSIENAVNSIATQVNNNTKQTKNISKNRNKIDENELTLLELKRNFEENMDKFNDMVKKVNEVESRMGEMNIYEIMKGSVGESGESSIALGLINNLDKSCLKKFKLIDDKFTKLDSDFQKIKTDTTNIKNNQEKNNKNIDTLQEKSNKTEQNFTDFGNNLLGIHDIIDNDIQNRLEKITIGFDDFKTKIESEYDKKLEDLKAQIEQIIAANTLSNTNENNENDAINSKTYKDLIKRITDLEKTVKIMPSQFNLDPIKNKIKNIEEEMGNKVTNAMFLEMSDIIKGLQTTLSNYKEDIDGMANDQDDHNELKALKTRVDKLFNTVCELKEIINNGNFDNINMDPSNKIKEMDLSKYLDKETFSIFHTKILKEFENSNDHFSSLRRLIEDIKNDIKQRVTFKDMKKLEDDINLKLEELKISSFKKFADKIETGKNVKYLDSQIKHIIEVYIKKMDKGESWLLAKKPLGGHLCASCENYIGDLRDNNTYVPWNKYPMRDPNDKLYRIGNGFSKMLQMINVEGDNSMYTGGNINTVTGINFGNNNNLTSQNFYNYENAKTAGNIGGNQGKRTNSAGKKSDFPKIIDKKAMNSEIIEQDDREMTDGDDKDEPKITKVYKKKK